jgi:hypothetical protein
MGIRRGDFCLGEAFIAARSVGDGVQVWALPPVLLTLLIVSYVTRPADRRLVLLRARA